MRAIRKIKNRRRVILILNSSNKRQNRRCLSVVAQIRISETIIVFTYFDFTVGFYQKHCVSSLTTAVVTSANIRDRTYLSTFVMIIAIKFRGDFLFTRHFPWLGFSSTLLSAERWFVFLSLCCSVDLSSGHETRFKTINVNRGLSRVS